MRTRHFSYGEKSYSNISDTLAWKALHGDPHHVALSYFGKRIPYHTLWKNVTAYSAFFASRTEAGSRVILFMPNMPELVYAAFGAMRAGCVACPIENSSLFTQIKNAVWPCVLTQEISAQFEHLKSAPVIVCADIFMPFLRLLGADYLNGKKVLVAKMSNSFPLGYRALYAVKTLYERRNRRSEYTLQNGATAVLSFSTTCDQWQHFNSQQEENGYRPPHPDDEAMCFHTSATADLPKEVLWTHHDMLVNTHQLRERLHGALSEGDTMLCVLPLCHIYSWMCCTTALLQFRGTIVLQPRFSPDACMGALRRARVKAWWGVNAMFAKMLAEFPEKRSWPPMLEFVFSGGSQLAFSVRQQLEKLGITVIEGYGLTETGILATQLLGDNSGLMTPLSDVHIRIPASGEIDDDGVILAQGPQLSRYGTNSWFNTGDLGVHNGQSGFAVVGRVKDLAKVNGESVSLPTVEQTVCRVFGTRHAVAVGIPHDTKGEAIGLCIVQNGTTRTAKEIGNHLRAINPLWEPVVVLEVAEKHYQEWITPIGKVLRRKAREHLLSQ